jgi:hypothetical protein
VKQVGSPGAEISLIFSRPIRLIFAEAFGVVIRKQNNICKDQKGSGRNLYMRGPLAENVSQTMESDMVNCLMG